MGEKKDGAVSRKADSGNGTTHTRVQMMKKDWAQIWANYGPKVGYVLLGIIIAHNSWHLPIWKFTKGWATIAYDYASPDNIEMEENEGFFAKRGW